MFNHPALQRLAATPHRAAFLSGLLAAVLLLASWSGHLLPGHHGHLHSTGISAMQSHAAIMLYGLFPFFITGFMLTVAPRWLNAPAPARWRAILMPLLLLLALPGALSSSHNGLLMAALCWLAALLLLAATLAQTLRRSTQSDRLHARAVLCALLLGCAGLLAMLLWLLADVAIAWWWMRNLALWGFLLPLFLAVCHRMLPFFSQSVLPAYTPWRPRWLLLALSGGSWSCAVAAIAGWPQWPSALLMALLSASCLWRWQSWRSRSVPLLAMLHLSFAWLPPAFILLALADIGLVSPLAGLHALSLGFFLTMLLGFASRVMLGHAGHALKAGRALCGLYLAAHVAAVLRVTAALWPAASAPLLPLAAMLLLLVLLGWAAFGAPLLWRARVDGKPG